MKRTVGAAMGAAWVVLVFCTPASAGDPNDGYTTEPTITFSFVSWLSPTHLGGHLVVDGALHGSGGEMKKACWEAWAARRNWMLEHNAGAEDANLPVPFPDVVGEPIPGVESAGLPDPSFCQGTAAKLTEPVIVDNTCEPGTVFAVRVNYYWVTGPDYGRFVESTITLSDTVDELIFHFCLDLFIDEDPASFLTGVPEPGFARSPDSRGVTGLATWLWYDFTGPASHFIEGTAMLDAIEGLPLQIVAEAWVDKVHWDLDGDGVWDHTLEIPDSWSEAPPHSLYLKAGGNGSEDGAVATFVYDTKGVYRVATGVVWRGTYRFTDPALDDVLYPYPPVIRTSTTTYPVVEIISRVQDTS